MAKTGSIKSFSLNGVNYPVANDSDFSRVPSNVKEGIATSGAPSTKFTRQVPTVEGIDLIISGADRENIKNVDEGTDPVDCAYTTANGDVYTASCYITITGDTTQDGKVSLTAIPTDAAGWVPSVV